MGLSSLITKIKSNKTFKSFGLVIVSRMLNAFLYLAYTIWLMEILNVEEYGRYSYYYSVVGIVPFLVNLGIDTSFVIIGSQKNEEDFKTILKGFWKLKIIICILLTILSGIYFLFSRDEFILVSLLSGILFGFSESFKPPAESQKNFNFVSYIIPIRNTLLILITVLLFFYGTMSIKNILYCLLIANTLNIVFIIFIYNKLVNKLSANAKVKLSDFFAQAKWVFIRDLMIIMMSRIEIFILEHFIDSGKIDEKELGYFSGAFTLCFILPIITNSLTNVLLPNVVRKNTKDSLQNYLKRLSKSVIIVLPVATLFYFSVIFAIGVLFGDKYDNSIPLFGYIIIATVFTFYTNNMSLIFYRDSGLKFIAILNIIQFIVSFVVSFGLIPMYGSLGAVLALLVVRIVGFVVVFFRAKYTLNQLED